MKSGPFIKAIANAYGVEEGTVYVISRLLKEAGLMTTGARGVNAPEMTPLDAARITIALLATDRPARAPEVVRAFADVTYSEEWSETKISLTEDAAIDDSLEDVLAAFFAFNPLLPVFYSVTVNSDAMTADIRLMSSGGPPTLACFTRGYYSRDDVDQALKAQFDRKGIQQSRTLMASDLIAVAIAITK